MKAYTYCSDCVWFQLNDAFAGTTAAHEFAYCSNGDVNIETRPDQLVSRTIRYFPPVHCHVARNEVHGKCGRDARYFTPKAED